MIEYLLHHQPAYLRLSLGIIVFLQFIYLSDGIVRKSDYVMHFSKLSAGQEAQCIEMRPLLYGVPIEDILRGCDRRFDGRVCPIPNMMVQRTFANGNGVVHNTRGAIRVIDGIRV